MAQLSVFSMPNSLTPAEIMLAIIMLLLGLFIVVLMLYFRAKHQRTSPILFVYAGDGGDASAPSRGLNTTVLKSLPVTVFRSADSKDGLMVCAVCLFDLVEGDAMRMLPGCRHGFHAECIDVWFQSNSTCPICRCSAEPPPATISCASPHRAGAETPEVGSEEGSSLSAAASPALARLRSLKRKLSVGRRGQSSAFGDIEQGAAPTPAAAEGHSPNHTQRHHIPAREICERG